MAALTNKERIGRVLDLVAEGLGPWMVSLLHAKYGADWARYKRKVPSVVQEQWLTLRSADASGTESRPHQEGWLGSSRGHLLKL